MSTLELGPAPKAATRDQDKVLTPEETLARARERLAKAGMDVYAGTERIDKGRLDIPVYFSRYGARAAALTGKRVQMGKGGTPEQAEASAVMELCERFSFYAYRAADEHFTSAKHKELGDRALSIERIAQSVNDQTAGLDQALMLFSEFPQRWCPATDLATGAVVLVPFDWFFLINEFNGTSAGNSPTEGVLQGLCEVAERHVCAVVARDQVPTPAIRPESATDPMAVELLEKFRRAGIVVQLNDLSLDTGVPTVAVLAYDPATLGGASEIVWTAGTAPDPQKALCRALTEAAQLGGDFNSGASYVASGLPKFRSLDEAEFVLRSEDVRDVADLPNLAAPDMLDELKRVVARLDALGMAPLVVDTTHPELGVPAYYTLAPGARFRERAAASSVGLFLARLACETQPPQIAAGILGEMERCLPGRYYMPFYAGTQLLAMGRHPQALAAFDASLARTPHPEDEPAVLTYKAMALKEMERYEEAEKVLEQADALDPERTDTLNLLGFCQFKQKRHAEAIKTFRRLVRLNPSSAIDYANIASNYRDMGDVERAVSYYETALELDPSIDFARENLERLRGGK